MKIKLTVAIIAILLIFTLLYYGMFQGSIESELAVRQLEDSTVSYSLSRAVTNGVIPIVAWILGGAILLCIWLPKKKS